MPPWPSSRHRRAGGVVESARLSEERSRSAAPRKRPMPPRSAPVSRSSFLMLALMLALARGIKPSADPRRC